MRNQQHRVAHAGSRGDARRWRAKPKWREQSQAGGVDLVLLQFSPQFQEMERFADQVIGAATSVDKLAGGPATRRRPGPVLRAALRLPVLLYRAGLGGLMGSRFLLITHRGRRSGRIFHTVVEVVRRDRTTGELVVSAAWGRKADWLCNILASPALAVTCGRRRFVPAQRLLAPPEAIEVLREYARAHPAAFRGVLRFIGLPANADLAAVAAALPMVGFRPTLAKQPV